MFRCPDQQDGNLTAFINQCPHLGISLVNNGGRFMDTKGQSIVCSTHGALFRPSDGLCTAGPCTGDYLMRIPIHVRDGRVFMGDAA